MNTSAEAATAARHRLAFIDQIRAIAALYVALYHALLVLWPADGPRPPWFLRWADFGHVAVAIFIVLSGYSLALGPALRGQRSAGRYGTFMAKRAVRLLPPYWVALAGSVILLMLAPHSVRAGGGTLPGEWAKGPVPGRSIVAFGLLVHDFVRVPSPNSPLWSIAVEFHLYFLFPLLVFLGCRYGMGKLVAGALGLGVALHFAVVHTSAAGTTPHFLALFCFGIASAYAVARRSARTAEPVPPTAADPPDEPARHGRNTRLGWGLVAAAACSFAALYRLEVLGDLVAGALLGGALYLLGSAPAPAGEVRPRTVGRWLMAVGAISYSLYLIHSPAEKIVWKLGVSKLGLGPVPSFVLLAVVGIGVALVGAQVLYLLVERPALRRSRQIHAVPRVQRELVVPIATTPP